MHRIGRNSSARSVIVVVSRVILTGIRLEELAHQFVVTAHLIESCNTIFDKKKKKISTLKHKILNFDKFWLEKNYKISTLKHNFLNFFEFFWIFFWILTNFDFKKPKFLLFFEFSHFFLNFFLNFDKFWLKKLKFWLFFLIFKFF